MKQENLDIINKYVNQTISYCENLVNAGECGEADVEKIVDALHDVHEKIGKINVDNGPDAE